MGRLGISYFIMSIMFIMINMTKSSCIFVLRIIVIELYRIYHVTLSIIVLAMYSRRRMDGRRTTSFPDLTATPKGTGQHSGGRLHALALDLLHDPDRMGDGGDEDEDDEPPDDISVAAGTVLLDYDSDQNSDFCHENTSSGAATGTATPAAADDTITFKAPEPMNVDVANNPTQASTGLLDPLYYQCRSARLAGFRDNLISVSIDDTLGKKILAPSPVIGTFETHSGIEKTFHGSRVLKRGDCSESID
jgi:hypothetical protein